MLFPDLIPGDRPAAASATPARVTADRSPDTPSRSTTANPPARANPWTRVGRSFTPTSDADEALARSGLDWSVAKTGLRTEDLTPVQDHRAMVRTDTGAVLGIVGADYEPLQNAEAFSFFRDLAAGGQISFETAGDFDKGRIVWVQARLPDLDLRIGDDESHSYLFISTGHTGNKTLMIAPTTVRIVCRNTLRMAEYRSLTAQRSGKSLEAGFTVRHTRGIRDALADIQDAYAQSRRSHTATMEAYRFLAGKPMSEKLKKTFFQQVFEAKSAPDESDRAASIRAARKERLDAILASPTSNVRGTAGSAFALAQAAVEYIDHDRTTRTSEGEDPTASRLLSATFGSGAGLKERAWSTIMDLVGA